MNSMSPLENLHYAIGELAYAVARADGKVQKEETDAFVKLVSTELQEKHYAFDVAEIIFKILSKDKLDTVTTYDWALHEIKTNSHYLSPELKKKFVAVMKKVAEAYLTVSHEEWTLIERFRRDIEPLHGDPVFYEKKAAKK